LLKWKFLMPLCAFPMPKNKLGIELYAWNKTWCSKTHRVNTKIGAVITQAGTLEGIENIKPPIRLFFIPYVSAYYQQDDFTADRTFKGAWYQIRYQWLFLPF
jgi:hypothetical protein